MFERIKKHQLAIAATVAQERADPAPRNTGVIAFKLINFTGCLGNVR